MYCHVRCACMGRGDVASCVVLSRAVRVIRISKDLILHHPPWRPHPNRMLGCKALPSTSLKMHDLIDVSWRPCSFVPLASSDCWRRGLLHWLHIRLYICIYNYPSRLYRMVPSSIARSTEIELL